MVRPLKGSGSTRRASRLHDPPHRLAQIICTGRGALQNIVEASETMVAAGGSCHAPLSRAIATRPQIEYKQSDSQAARRPFVPRPRRFG
jgi:hypothetical protein